MTRARRCRFLVLGTLGILAAGCTDEPLAWSDITLDTPPLPASVALGPAWPSSPGCVASVRAARKGSRLVAAWWLVRRDSSATLLVSQSGDAGKTWTPPVVADSTDRSTRGCGRPPPALAADSASGYIYLAYFAEPPSGSGIFFAHSMDGGRTFHEAVPIVFGDKAAWVSVSGAGDHVAVAYEDPNSSQSSVGVGLSRTMGHIFKPGEIVSGDNERARQPTVEVRGDTVRLWWNDYSADPRISATRTAYREGVWR